jgi:formylglycine-generating enzyme required for sulfatase activity
MRTESMRIISLFTPFYILKVLFSTVLMSALGGCEDNPSHVVAKPDTLNGLQFFRFQFKEHKETILFAKREISCGEFCEFLNAVAYQQEPFVVRHFQPQYRQSSPESSNYESIYLVEHRESNVTRSTGRFIPKGVASEPINCVTFFGAQAYCEWLSSRLGKKVALPSDKIWLACAKIAQRHNLPLEGCPGGVWEWCSDIVCPKDNSMPTKAVVRGGEYFSRRRAHITDKSYSLFQSGGEGEQGQGLRIVVSEKQDK